MPQPLGRSRGSLAGLLRIERIGAPAWRPLSGLCVLQTSLLMTYNEAVSSTRTIERIAPFAQEQWGLITRRQAAAGVPPTTLTRLIRGGSLERVASGVYHLSGAPWPDHVELRAAWLQLAPEVPAWLRSADQGVVSHRSAALLYGIGELPADRHDFTLGDRRQTRRRDVRLHVRRLGAGEWVSLRGIPVTRPARIAADLLLDHEDPEAVARMIVDATRQVYDYPANFAAALAPHARSLGMPIGDGLAVLRRMYEQVGDPQTPGWLNEATNLSASEGGSR